MKSPSVVKVAMVVLASTLCAACAHRLVKKNSSMEPASQETSASASPTEVSDTEPSMRGAALHSIPELKTIHFDYDSSFLKPEALTILAANAEWLKSHDDVRVQVAGNCDQRGTVEYNLALGQRRAAAVREYYLHMGVASGRVATISYGKEKQLCQEANEGCWRKNRRAETWGTSPTVANSR